MKHYHIAACLLLAAMMLSCSKNYDDSDLVYKVNENKESILTLEERLNRISRDIDALRTLVGALDGNVYIKTVRDNGAEGYVITFTDNTSITLRHGDDGAAGVDGASGAPGRDGTVLGVMMHEGIYYWTVTTDGMTSWLLDDKGRKIRVTGTNGAGNSAGVAGEAGADGKTPLLRISASGLWEVSYDGGETYVLVTDASGNYISAFGSGEGDVTYNTLFVDIRISQSYVSFILADGTALDIPSIDSFYLSLAFDQKVMLRRGETCRIYFTVNSPDRNTHVECMGTKHLVGKVTYHPGDSSGYIELALRGNIQDDERMLVYLCNDNTTITYAIHCYGYASDGVWSDVGDEWLYVDLGVDLINADPR